MRYLADMDQKHFNAMMTTITLVVSLGMFIYAFDQWWFK